MDRHTQAPVFGANVVVVGTNRGAATDESGEYVIPTVPVGTYPLRFSCLGYKPELKTDVVVKTAVPALVDLALDPEAVQGEGVTVRAAYFAAAADPAPSTLELSREEIRRFPGGFEDVVRTVSTLPGVAVNMSAGRNDLLVRGGGPSENLYLVNGIEVPNINHFGTPGNTGGSLSFVNLDFVDEVSFSTGGFGARYGDKMSSVISLTLSRKNPERLQFKGTVSATQFGLNAEAPVRDSGFLAVSARKSYLDLIFKAAGLPFVPVYTDFNVLFGLDLTPKDRIFVLGLSAINNVDRNVGTLENRVFNAGLLDNTQYKGIAGVSYRRLLPGGYADLTFGVNLSRFRLSQLDESLDTYFRSDADEWETAVKAQVFQSLSRSLDLLAGASVKSVRNDNRTAFADTVYDRSGNRLAASSLGLPAESSFRASGLKSAGFVELEWSPGPLWTLNAGVRADRHGFIDESVSVGPRVSARYRVDDRNTVRLGGGVYSQSPSYVWTVNPVNRSLKALRNRMAVAGWDFLLRPDTRVSLEAYEKRYDRLPTGTVPGVNDYIVLTNTGTSYGGREDDFQSFGLYVLASEGKGWSRGIEVSVQKKFSEVPLYGLISLALGKSEFTAADGRTVPGQFDQRLILNVSGGYIFNSKWEVSAKFRAYSGIPYTPVYRPSENPSAPGRIQSLPEEYLAARLDPGHHLDVRVDRYFNFPRLTLIVYADVQNAYNNRLPMVPTYDFWADEVVDRGDIAILPSIGVSVEF